MMQRVVLDTNVLVSSYLFGGIPHTLFDFAVDRQIVGIISPAILEELARTLKEKFSLPDNEFQALQHVILESFDMVIPDLVVSILKDDPDNRILEAAAAGRCDTIVTGDKKILALGMYEDIAIMSPASFAALLESEGT